MSDDEIVWRPDAATLADANLTHFMQRFAVEDYQTLQRRADTEPEWFHEALIEHFDFRFIQPYSRVLDESDGIEHVRWCVGGTTNIVLNCLDRWGHGPTAGKCALRWEGESGEIREFSYAQLLRRTASFAGGLRALGLGPGDVIGLYLPNLPEAVIALLAIARIGAIALPLFSGFGADALATRLADSGARAVITVDGSLRRGRWVAAKPVVDEAVRSLPAIAHVIVLRHAATQLADTPPAWHADRDVWWHELTDSAPPADVAELDAEAPLLVIYTSGTTGKPKGVVHSHCGFGLKLALDLGLCMDFKPSDRILWMADMGWLVGPILVFGALLLGGTVVLAEGAPDHPEPDRMWRLVDRHRVSYLGIAPTVVRMLMAVDRKPLTHHDLSSLRLFTSTGEPWTIDAWLWLFREVGGGRLPLLNFSGGTEVGGIVVSTVIHPLKPCSFTGPVPGTGADVVDIQGNTVPVGEVGELVMRRPSVGLTRGLWHDEQRYLDTYWRPIPGLWMHGDLASVDADGFWFVHGRSDDTLKIAGKRTGPAEVESLLLQTGLVAEAAAVGSPHPIKGTALLCFCVPAAGVAADPGTAQRLSEAVVDGLGVPFRPSRIVFVPELPKTRNMKIMRRVVRAVWLGQSPGDLSSLVNPHTVDQISALRDA
ncbi:MAG: AMP-binding protein [Gammaproteobacteria bacterium]|nr:AMP-binding protein [Gammaproteobacteria bacterium]